MRAVIQRVSRAVVLVAGEAVGRIDRGLMVLAGAMHGDEDTDAAFIANKVCTLRVFPDEDGRMNLNVLDVDGAVLLISQFTLSADTASGSRPSFSKALAPELAEPLVGRLASLIEERGVAVEQGVFGAKMSVELVNDGPVTIVLDSQAKVRK